MINAEIKEFLIKHADEKYRAFQSKLIPTVPGDTVIGVRTPVLRSYAKELAKRPDCDVFLHSLAHGFFEENQFHAFVISLEKDFEKCIARLDEFLPYIDNWATCDQLSPKAFVKHHGELLPQVLGWLGSNHTYTIRFAILTLMNHYLDGDFSPRYPELVAGIQSGEYYVNMMRAWYFATALFKQYDTVIPYLEDRRLDPWTHNKTIQKAIESRRITPEQKEYLKTLK